MNYVAIAEALQISPSVLAAGLAADNVICAVYFTTLFALAAKIAPESSALPTGSLGLYSNLLFIICYFVLWTKLKSFALEVEYVLWKLFPL